MLQIDAHIHLYHESVMADPAAWGKAQGEPWWTRCVAPTNRRSLQGWATVDELLRAMDDAGVDRCVLLGWYWEQQSTCELQNQWYINWVTAHPDRLSGFATVQPNSGKRGLDNVRYAIEHGLCGIGEIMATAQHFEYECENWLNIVEFARQMNLPINLHVSDPAAVALSSLTLETPLRSFVELIRKFPDNRFILAHWGGGLPFYELNSRIKKLFKNVYYDTAASPLLYSSEVFQNVLNLIGPNRILFGTDFPLLCHFRECQTPGFTRSISDILNLEIPPEDLKKIMGENARRLLGL